MVEKERDLIVVIIGILIMSSILLLSSSSLPIVAASAVKSQQANQPTTTTTTMTVNRTQGIANVTQTIGLETAKEQYLSVWNHTTFHSAFDTYIQGGWSGERPAGVYKEHKPKDIFSPGETLLLYVEPLGYGFNHKIDENGNTVFLINNFTVNILGVDARGKQVMPPFTANPSQFSPFYSYNKVTETSIVIPFLLDRSTPLGHYQIRYFVGDGASREVFEIDKNITVANIMSSDVTSGPPPGINPTLVTGSAG